MKLPRRILSDSSSVDEPALCRTSFSSHEDGHLIAAFDSNVVDINILPFFGDDRGKLCSLPADRLLRRSLALRA